MKILVTFKHTAPCPPDLLTGLCQDGGIRDQLADYLTEACACTAINLRILPGDHWVDREGCRFYVHVSDQFVIVTLGELDDDHLRGVTLHRRSRHVNIFFGTPDYIRDICTAIAKESL